MNSARAAFVSVAILLACPGVRSDEVKRATIWKVSDADSTVYLAGSVHLLRPEDLPIPAAFEEAYAESEEIVFEIDMREMSTPEAAERMQRLTSLPEGESLSDHFSEETIQLLRAYLKTNRKPAGLFDRSRPSSVLLMLSALEAVRHGARPELGLESTFFKKCREDEKPSAGLESIEFQIALLDAFDDSEIEKMVREELERVDESGDNFNEIVMAWREGDGEKLAGLLEKEETFTPELREILLTKRNRSWIPKIEEALAKDHDFFFLVGSAHLVGEGSVVTFLREKGLEVMQVESPKSEDPENQKDE